MNNAVEYKCFLVVFMVAEKLLSTYSILTALSSTVPHLDRNKCV